MKILLLYLLLTKANVMSFSGLGSLPIMHADLVEKHHILTERQLNIAVAAGRSGPGPMGLYTVVAGYFAAGVPGAIAGYLAMVTPAFLILILLHYASARADHPRVRRAIRAILLCSAGLLVSSAIPLGGDAVSSPPMALIAAAAFLVSAMTKVETAWVVIGAAIAGVATAAV